MDNVGGSASQTQQASKRQSKRSPHSKKLVFLSRKVLEEVINNKETTGTKIANKILDIYKDKKINMDFKNVQRRVYDALNVLSALSIILKDRNRIKFRGSPFVHGGGVEQMISVGSREENVSRINQEKREREM
jgi:DNA gyrase/topoisomerase IV subunit B